MAKITKFQNAASKEILADVLRRRKIKFTKITTLSRAGKRSAGRYKITFKK